MSRFLLAMMVIGSLAALAAGYVPAAGRAEGWAIAYAKGLSVAHREAIAIAVASPTFVGDVTLPTVELYANMTVRSCKDAETVATWLPPGSFNPELPIAPALHTLSGRDPGAGIARQGRVLSEPGWYVPLPCAVPDGSPVIATVWRG